jgi:dolichol-phosphate mannosyltransferase
MYDYSSFTIVIPTLNEAKNVRNLINSLLLRYKGVRIIIVDDGSKDDTQKLVREMQSRLKGIRLIDRSKKVHKGLTVSVIDGILESKTKYIIVMDADMQHPLGKVKEIVIRLIEGKTLVVAVRKEFGEWSFYRKVISKSFMILGNCVLYIGGKERCDDIFSGFFGVERKVFSEVYRRNEKRFVRYGYKVLFDFLKCNRRGTLRIAEVPYAFMTRKYGTSKAGFRHGIALLRSFVT